MKSDTNSDGDKANPPAAEWPPPKFPVPFADFRGMRKRVIPFLSERTARELAPAVEAASNRAHVYRCSRKKARERSQLALAAVGLWTSACSSLKKPCAVSGY